jgi:hypothetical protein
MATSALGWQTRAGERQMNRRSGRNEVGPTAIITCIHGISFYGLIIISPSLDAHMHPLKEASSDSFVQLVTQQLIAPPPSEYRPCF